MISRNSGNFSSLATYGTLALVALLALGSLSCGGGGGSSQNRSNEPAPQTMNGIMITLFTGGPQLTFIAAGGDPTTGTEVGAVSMAPNPVNTSTVTSDGTRSPLTTSPTISGARFEYQRVSPERGVLRITGNGQTGAKPPPFGPIINYFAGSFDRTFELLFGSSGGFLSAVDIRDYPTELGPGGGSIFWIGSNIRLANGTQVPVGWTFFQSTSLNLPNLYPDGITGELLVVTPDVDPEEDPEVLEYRFLTSDFTRLLDPTNSFLIREIGVGNLFTPGSLVAVTVNYEYIPNQATTNTAELKVVEEHPAPIGQITRIYKLTFLDFEKGVYIGENGSTGVFEFPFLD